MTTQQKSTKYLLLAVIWTIITLFALFAPESTVKVDDTFSIPGLDKVAHFILFAIWSFLVAKALSERKKSIDIWLFGGGFVVLAVLTEVIQHYIGRTFEWQDILADITGIVISLLIYKRV